MRAGLQHFILCSLHYAEPGSLDTFKHNAVGRDNIQLLSFTIL
jgi:hypothetical protein